MKRLILFTDLDGTLLDHETYSFEAARPVLARLKQMAVPVILASSKTAAEIANLQRALGLATMPAIVENGAGVVWPNGTADIGEDRYDAVCAEIDRLDDRLRRKFRGFSDWTVEEVVAHTGLDRAAARRAKQRRFSEPGIFSGSPAEREEFAAALRARGLQARMGGRFLTVSLPCSKAQRMREIVARLMRETGEELFIVALGDAQNDVEMLEAADIGIIVANPAHDPLPELAGEGEGRIVRTHRPGPEGWVEAVAAILDKEQRDG